MASVENVVIQITSKASTREIRATRRELERMAAAGQLGNTTHKDLVRYLDKADERLKRYKKTIGGVTKMITSMNKIALKLFTIGFAIGAAALAANNALFAIGRKLVDAYKWAMQGLTVVVAAVGAGLAVAAAAFREYTAAVNAYAYKSSPALKNKMSEASAALRNIEEDATLATFGMQALSQAFASISKNAQVTGTSKSLLKGLADFAAAGGDPAKNLAAAGEFIGLLQKSGKLDAQAIAAAQGIGPAFVEALKKARQQGVQTLDQFKAMLSSGELARLGGVEGQAAIVGNTVFGQFKAIVVRLKNLFGDLGQSLLGPLKAFMGDVEQIFQRLMSRIGPSMMKFGNQRMFGGLVAALEKLEDLTVNLFTKYLDSSTGMLQRFKAVWDQIVFVVKDLIDRLRGLLPIGTAVIEAFGKPFVEIFTTIGQWVKYVGETVRKNQDKYNEFGQQLLRLVEKIQEIGKEFIDVFTAALPTLNQVLSWAINLLDTLMSITRVLGGLGGLIGSVSGGLGLNIGGKEGVGGLSQMMGMIGVGMLVRGRLRRLKNLPVHRERATAGSELVNIAGNGPIPRVLRRFGSAGGRIGGAAQRVGGFMGRYRGFRQGSITPTTLAHGEHKRFLGGGQYEQGQYIDNPDGSRRFVPRGGVVSYGSTTPGQGRIASLVDSFLPAADAVPGGRAARMALAWKASRKNSNAKWAGRLSGMGPAAMLGIGSMFAAPEAQQSMQTGAMVAGLAPMLGKAGPMAALAGVGIAGYGMMKNSRTAKGGALGGAMTGAALGGALGSIIPGVGTALGAVIGAAAGTIIGFVKGRANADKIKVEKVVGEYSNKQLTGFTESLIKGDTSAIRKRINDLKKSTARAKMLGAKFEEAGKWNRNEIVQGTKSIIPAVGMIKTANRLLGIGTDRGGRQRMANDMLARGEITEEEATALAAAPGTYMREIEEVNQRMEKVMTGMADKFDSAGHVAKTVFGMTGDELQKLALEKGVNLYDQTKTLQEQFVALGLAAEFTASQIQQAIRDIAVNAMSGLQASITQGSAGSVMNEITEALYSELASGGKVDQKRLGDYTQQMFDQLMLLNPNDPLKAYSQLNELIGTGGRLFEEGQQLAGMGQAFAGVSGKVTGSYDTVLQDTRTSLADMISKQALLGNVALDKESLASALAGMGEGELRQLQKNFETGKLDVNLLTQFAGLRTAEAGGQIQNVLRGLGIGGVAFSAVQQGAMTPEQMIEAYGEEGMAMITGMQTAIESAYEKSPEWYKKNPTWMNATTFLQALDPDGDQKLGPDTSTPRGDTTSSRLGRTLTRHNYFDSMLTGKRMMTSSYRTTNLGSINSDHVMGKAYDLVGQNLGAYATMVNRAGGFAEFHGRGGGRHLHVVPGETPAGDSTAPYMGAVATAAPAAATTNYYNITVTGSPGMDVSALADEVMTRIQRIERSMKERS